MMIPLTTMPFTARAREILAIANKEAHEWNHDHIGTEHILMGLIKETSKNGFGYMVLNNLNVNIYEIENNIIDLISKGPYPPNKAKKLPLTPRANRVIECATEIAGSMKHDSVGTEHIILGLMESSENTAAQILISRGVTKEEIKTEVFRLLDMKPNNIKTCENCVCSRVCSMFYSMFLNPAFPNKEILKTMFGEDEEQLIEEIKQLIGQKCEVFEKRI